MYVRKPYTIARGSEFAQGDWYLSKPARITIALLVVGAFLWLATRADVYDATSPRFLTHSVFGAKVPNMPHPWWLALHIWLRKVYSVAAFACVGATVHLALDETSRPRLRAAVIVAVFSASIEFAQYALAGIEPFAERILDVVCGAVGGWAGVVVIELAQRWRLRRQT